MKVLKRIGAILIDTLLVLLLLVSAFSVISSINEKKTGFSNCFGIGALSVQSDSMSGTFEKGDLIFCTTFDREKDQLKCGDIVTFPITKDGKDTVNTHRITRIVNEKIYTQGDNRERCPREDDGYLLIEDILGVYSGHKINGFGKVVDFVKNPNGIGFLVCIVIPIVAYISYQIIYIIRLYNSEKKIEMVEEAKAGTSDEVKDAIIKEYLEKQKKLEESQKVDSETINKPDGEPEKPEEVDKNE